MYTVRQNNQDVQVPDLPTLAAKLKAGEVAADAAVYEHASGAWTTVAAVTAPPGAATREAPPAQAAPPPVQPAAPPSAAQPPGKTGKVVSWIVCVVLVLLALGAFARSDVAWGFLTLVVAALFCPPLVEAIRRISPKVASLRVRIFVAVALMLIGGLIPDPEQAATKPDKAPAASVAQDAPKAKPTPAPSAAPQAAAEAPAPDPAPPGTDVLIELVRAEESANGSYWSLVFRATNLTKKKIDALNTTITVEGMDGLPMGTSHILMYRNINPGQYQVDDNIWDKRGPIKRVLVNITYDYGSMTGKKVVVRSLVSGLTAVLQ